MTTLKKSILASILIGFGVAILLSIGNPVGPFLFAFGLLSVCYLKANLFTGKAGYYWKDKNVELFKILLINLISGYIFGFLLSYSSPQLIPVALEKVTSWEFSIVFFIKAIFCGMIMYICVELYNKYSNFFGIFFGVPLFIYCGFQHSIANIIILGVAKTWSWTIILAIMGNYIGSMIINVLAKGEMTYDT